MILGITGGSGCGKTTLLSIIAEHGGVVIDCDRLYHCLLKTDKDLLQRIEDRFPGVVENGELNRSKLGNLVFSDEAALLDLNRITHQAVYQAVLKQLTPEPKLAAVDAIGLFESGLNKLCKLTIAVNAPLETRLARLTKRDNITNIPAFDIGESLKNSLFFTLNCSFIYTTSNMFKQARLLDFIQIFISASGIPFDKQSLHSLSKYIYYTNQNTINTSS